MSLLSSLNQDNSSCPYHVSSILKIETRNTRSQIENVLKNQSQHLIFPVYNSSQQHWAIIMYARYLPSKIFFLQSKIDVETSLYADVFLSKMKKSLHSIDSLDIIQKPQHLPCDTGMYVISLLHMMTTHINQPLIKYALKEQLQKNLHYLHQLNNLPESCNTTKTSLCLFCEDIFRDIPQQHFIRYRGISNSGSSCYLIAMFQMMFTDLDWFIEIATNINKRIKKNSDHVWLHLCNMMFGTMTFNVKGTLSPVEAKQISVFKKIMKHYCPKTSYDYLYDKQNTQFGADDVIGSLYDIDPEIFQRFQYVKEEFFECEQCHKRRIICTPDYMMRIGVIVKQ